MDARSIDSQPGVEMRKFLLRAALVTAFPGTAFAVAVPAMAATPISPCDPSLTNPNAIACAGYYSGNLINGSPEDILNQQQAIATLPGGFVFDGNWAALDPEFKITSLTNGNQLNFGTTMFGNTIIGAHFGNVAGPAGNVSVFWQFDFGETGASHIALDNTQGFSNAVLYTARDPGAVPEPGTWAMMLVGFGAVGFGLRRRKAPVQRLRVAYA